MFLLILELEKHAVHNAVTSINNFLMQSEIWCNNFRIAFSRSTSVIISNKILLISARDLEERCELPSGVRGGAPESKAF